MAIIKRVKAVIQLRRALESEWERVDPILRLGEPALSTDVYRLKIGDGHSHWSELDYLNEAEFQQIQNQIDNLELSDLVDDFLLINCGTSTTVI